MDPRPSKPGVGGSNPPGRAKKTTCRICGDRGHSATRCPLGIAATAHPSSVPAPELARIRLERRVRALRAEAVTRLRAAGIPEPLIRWGMRGGA